MLNKRPRVLDWSDRAARRRGPRAGTNGAEAALAEGPAPVPRKGDARNRLPGASPLKYAAVTAHRRLVPSVGPEVRL